MDVFGVFKLCMATSHYYTCRAKHALTRFQACTAYTLNPHHLTIYTSVLDDKTLAGPFINTLPPKDLAFIVVHELLTSCVRELYVEIMLRAVA